MTALTPAMRAAFRPPEPMTVSQWVDRNVVLGADSAEPGPYCTDRTPYVREWQDSAAIPHVHQVTIVKSTQVGGSVALLNVLAYAIAQEPGPITWVMPTREDAEEVGENRVQPMVDLCPALRAQLTGERFDAKKRQIRFKRCRLLFRSARVPKELAQYPARWLFGDEAGKWPAWTQSEAAPFDLARERTRTFWNHKVYLNSTPTVPDAVISVEFERGDRRRFWVPCPLCGRFQVLRWPQVKFNASLSEDELRRTKAAHYECEHCSKPIPDTSKQAMLQAGVWCPEAVGDPTPHMVEGRLVLPNDRAPHRSYHLWAGYSPWLAWWEIAAEFLRSKDNPATLQNFVNSWLGEPWEQRVAVNSDSAVAASVDSDRPQRSVPDDVLVVTAAVDVQHDRLEWCVQGWGYDEESWVLGVGVVPKMAGAEDWRQLGDVLFRQTWGRHRVRLAVIDVRGGRGDEVLDWVTHWTPNAIMIAGVEMDGPDQFRTRKIEKHPRTGQALESSLVQWSVNVSWFKDLVAARIARAVDDPQHRPGRIHLPNDLPESFLKQIASEQKVLERRGRKQVHRWILKPGHQRNEAWDLLVYGAAAARMLKVDRLHSAEHRPARQQQAIQRATPPIRPRRSEIDYPLLGGGL